MRVNDINMFWSASGEKPNDSSLERAVVDDVDGSPPDDSKCKLYFQQVQCLY